MSAMKPREKLWIVSGATREGEVTHRTDFLSGHFVPISDHGQVFDPAEELKVIPLRGVSC
jgi:hypothetical protein